MAWEDNPEVEEIIDDLAEYGDVGRRLIEAVDDAKSLAEFKHILETAIAREHTKLDGILEKVRLLEV